jgi:xylan 1,4-beta-xylosidase
MPHVALPSARLIDGRAPADVEMPHAWNECIGAGRANEALRADWQSHFREAVDVLGARSVRFHGVFHDDMFVYRANDGGGFGPPEPLAEPVFTLSATPSKDSRRGLASSSSCWTGSTATWPRPGSRWASR